ncbi:hypothetical protein G6F50_017616 [Rhizopus delemar]|uniref:LysR substrate-binding domain-containing protein n=1 Tax=Rhizopus delemar TaxID=936053 RepID=A0A9P6XPM6_9FUNG|nr:hypothetical protein G6F50_017616 [Rhizopus delemar]
MRADLGLGAVGQDSPRLNFTPFLRTDVMAIAHRDHPLAKPAVVRLRGGAGRHRRHYAAGFRHAGEHDPGAGHRAGDDGDPSGQRAVGLRYHAGLPRSGGAAAGVAAVG